MKSRKSDNHVSPKKYSYILCALWVVYILIFLSGIFAFLLVEPLLRLIHSRDSLIVVPHPVLSTNPIVVLLLFVASMALVTIVGLLIIEAILLLFPQFRQYKLIKERDFSKKHSGDRWRRYISVASWISLIAIPIITLGIDSYVKLKPDGLYINSYLELKDKRYGWQDVKEVNVYAEKGLSCSRVCIDFSNTGQPEKPYRVFPHFELTLKSGEKIDIWRSLDIISPNKETLLTITDLLEGNGVRFDVVPLDPELSSLLANKHPLHVQQRVIDVFGYIERIE